MKIKEIHKKLQKFDLNKTTTKVLKTKSVTIQVRQLIIDQQRLTEQNIGNYSKYTQGIKDFSKYMGDFPKMDLFDTGKFQKGIFIEYQGADWSFWSRDSKTNDLVSRFGELIFNLIPKNMAHAKKIVSPKVQEQFNNIFK